jgi:competence protein ComEA
MPESSHCRVGVKPQILAYLARPFSSIRVNKATAKDLEAWLGVPAKVAEGVVGYRLEKGEFKTIDDLTKVPGLGGSEIEALKARIVF